MQVSKFSLKSLLFSSLSFCTLSKNSCTCAPIWIKFAMFIGGLKVNTRINFGVDLINIWGAISDVMRHAYRVNHFEEQAVMRSWSQVNPENICPGCTYLALWTWLWSADSKKGKFRWWTQMRRSCWIKKMASLWFLNEYNAPTDKAKLSLPLDLWCPSEDVLNKTIIFFCDEIAFQSNDDWSTFKGTKKIVVMKPKNKGSR